MDERERGADPLVAQVRVVARELRRGEHALVDDGARRERRDRDLLARARLDHAPHDVETALERELGVVVAQRRLDEDLPDERLDGGRARAGDVMVDRHVAPSEQALAAVLDGRLHDALDLAPRVRLAREEAHTDAVAAALGQFEVGDLAQELVGRLHQDAGAIAGVELGAARPAVLEVVEHPEGLAYGLVRATVRQVGDGADAARVVLKVWVVEARGPRTLESVHDGEEVRPPATDLLDQRQS